RLPFVTAQHIRENGRTPRQYPDPSRRVLTTLSPFAIPPQYVTRRLSTRRVAGIRSVTANYCPQRTQVGQWGIRHVSGLRRPRLNASATAAARSATPSLP